MKNKLSSSIVARYHRFSAAVLSACVLATVAAGIYITSRGNAATVPAVSDAGQASTYWLHLDSSAISANTIATEAPRRRFVVLNSWEGSYVAKFKAANPSILVLAYKDLSSTRDYACSNGQDNAELPTGVGYCLANSQHSDWFLTANGSRLTYGSYAGHWQMDIGNAAYLQAWAANVKTDLKANGFDGVYIDNILVHCNDYHSGACPTKYPTDASFETAYRTALASVTPVLEAAGLKAMGNLNGVRLVPGLWNSYIDNLDGGFDEFWLSFATGNYLSEYGSPSVGWKAQVDELSYAESHNKFAGVQPHFTAGDTQGFRYAFASLMLANAGRSSMAELGTVDAYGPPPVWHAEYGWDLGAAAGAYYQIAGNVYRRDFACGTAIVNANASGSAGVAVPLEKSMQTQDGATVQSISLGGTQGAVLRIPGCSPAAITPTPHPVSLTPKPATPTPTSASAATPQNATPKPTSAQAAGDTSAPATPGGFRLALATATELACSWDASSDNRGVAGYRLYRNNVKLADQTALSYLDTGLHPGTLYSYAVEAYDAAGNVSNRAVLAASTQQAVGAQSSNSSGNASPITVTPSGVAAAVPIAAGEQPLVSGEISLATTGGGSATISVDGVVVATNGRLDTTYLTNGAHIIAVKQGGVVASRTMNVSNTLTPWQTIRNTLFAPFHGNKQLVNGSIIVLGVGLLAAAGTVGYVLIMRRRRGYVPPNPHLGVPPDISSE